MSGMGADHRHALSGVSSVRIVAVTRLPAGQRSSRGRQSSARSSRKGCQVTGEEDRARLALTPRLADPRSCAARGSGRGGQGRGGEGTGGEGGSPFARGRVKYLMPCCLLCFGRTLLVRCKVSFRSPIWEEETRPWAGHVPQRHATAEVVLKWAGVCPRPAPQ